MYLEMFSQEAARRNLVLVSLAIIMADLSGANLRGDMIGSVKLDNPERIQHFTWMLYSWFLLRVWQFTHHREDWCRYKTEMYAHTVRRDQSGFIKVLLFLKIAITTEYFGQFYLPYIIAAIALGI